MLIASGIYWLPFLRQWDPLIRKEIESMRKHGKFEDDPEYMRTYRVADSEGALITNMRNIKLCKIAIIIGSVIIVILVIKAIFF